jgi:hypothetical protein
VRGIYINYENVYSNNRQIIKALDKDLIKMAERFYASNLMGIKVSDLIHNLNPTLIDDVVLNTIVDLERIKKYHPVDKPTSYKYAAYIGFWWERIRPFSCKVDDYQDLRLLSEQLSAPNVEPRDAFPIVLDVSKSINEIFICNYILKKIKISSNQTTTCVDNQGKMTSYNDIVDSLEYFLRYRHYNAQSLELFLKGLNMCPISSISETRIN